MKKERKEKGKKGKRRKVESKLGKKIAIKEKKER